MKAIPELQDHLLKNHSPATVKIYLQDIRLFLDYIGEEKAEKALYRDIVQYVGYLRRQYQNPATVNRMLYGVKAWYRWLLESGKRDDHPCRYLTLKDAGNHDVQLQDLFTPDELQGLMERKERFESVRIRNQAVISLLIYQALRVKEICRLMLQDIDLEKGTIHVRETVKTAGRVLSMKAGQVMLFHRYIHEIRPKAVKEETGTLLLNMRGKAITGEDISYLVETFRHRFPGRRLHTKTIRQSVIANLLKGGKDLRLVQTFAGHMKVSSTERYRQTGLEELKAAIQKHHPLG